ncbi:MAG: hypothetical protein LWW85_00575 [Marinilabiliales bacterium]|nr:hypothetical protein [Marinilabiliales bacterium]
MKKYPWMLLLSTIVWIGCQSGSRQEKARQEILATEKAFEAMAKEKGIMEAFTSFADERATIQRGQGVITGREAIQRFYSDPRFKKTALRWKPDFVEVAASCDLGYTYGNYTYSVKDSTGKWTDFNGIFHTVWKKRSNGAWKFVWD